MTAWRDQAESPPPEDSRFPEILSCRMRFRSVFRLIPSSSAALS